MHRQHLLQKLQSYNPIDDTDAATLKRFIEFINAHPDCFERSLKVGHITGSAWIVNQARNATLLTHHRKLDIWIQLGGHTDGNPDTLASAIREGQEESGIDTITPLSESIFDVDIHPIPARGDEPEHFHYDVRYAFIIDFDQPFTVSEESIDLAWVPINDLEQYSQEQSMLRMKRKWDENWLKLKGF
jgi:8-oxo-dGTP pyrophosphatase MutT (NUDIX family)